MSKSRPKRAVSRWGKPFPHGKTPKTPAELPSAAPLSLPPADAGQALVAPVTPPTPEPTQFCTKCGTAFLKRQDVCGICGEWSPEKQAIHPSLRLADDSPLRIRALKIWAMRKANVSDEGIAAELGIAKSTVYTAIYRAGLNGWLDFEDPRDSLEYQLLPKALKVLNDSLSDTQRNTSTGMEVRTAVALHVADGALYPKGQNAPQAASTIVGIKVQIVGGDPGTIREGTVMGANAYVDAETE